MANEKNNVANATSGATENVAQVFSGIITKVMIPSNSDNRISIVTSIEFPVVDFTTGEEKQTNIIGINTYNLVNQLANIGGADYVVLADALCMGQPINPQIVSLSLVGAEIQFQRVIHRAGETREFDGTYSSDCYTTKVLKIKTNIKPIFEKMLVKLVETQPYAISHKVEDVKADLTSLDI